MAVISSFFSPPTSIQFQKSRPVLSPFTKVSMLNKNNEVPLKHRKPFLLQIRSFNNQQVICNSSKNPNNNTEMDFGVRVATHSMLKDLNNSCQKNLLFSPLSLHIGFNLLTAGAKGPTLDQLLCFLDSENITKRNAQSSIFMDLVTSQSSSGSGPTISMVNGLWVDEYIPLKHSFKQLAEDVYKANCQSVAFYQAKQVANDINLWAKEASKGHISELVTSDDLRDSVLVLANALHFKGSWLEQFDAYNTRDEDFHLLNGKQVRVPFMKQQGTYKMYGEFEGFKLLKMEYKKGQDNKNYAMYIFLPDEYDGLQPLIQKFHTDPRYFMDNHELQSVKINNLWLPKLKYDYKLNMAENIQELGLDLPFLEDADLTEVIEYPYNVYVSNMIQKSYIEVNEEGTAATSSTAINHGVGCSRREKKPPINFVADHPFLFMIKEETSGVVLFVGTALNPL